MTSESVCIFDTLPIIIGVLEAVYNLDKVDVADASRASLEGIKSSRIRLDPSVSSEKASKGVNARRSSTATSLEGEIATLFVSGRGR